MTSHSGESVGLYEEPLAPQIKAGVECLSKDELEAVLKSFAHEYGETFRSIRSDVAAYRAYYEALSHGERADSYRAIQRSPSATVGSLMKDVGLTMDEIETLAHAAAQDKVKEAMRTLVIEETRWIQNTFSQNEAFVLEHTDVFQEAKRFFDERGTGWRKSPTALFLGTKVLMLISTAAADKGGFVSASGQYFETHNIYYVDIGTPSAPTDQEQAIHVSLHEAIHGQGHAKTRPFIGPFYLAPEEITLASGFVRRFPRRAILGHLNEGTVEYFTSKIAGESREEHDYLYNLTNMHALLSFLAERERRSAADIENSVLTSYQSEDGILMLGRLLNTHIGPFGLQAVDMLCGDSRLKTFLNMRSQFIESRRLPEERLQISLSQIRKNGIDPSAFIDAHPFVAVGQRIYNEKIKDIQWIPYQASQ